MQRYLKRFATGDEPHSTGALVDDGGAHRIVQIVRARFTAGVDHVGLSHKAIRHLIAHQVDGVRAGQIAIDFRMGLAELQRVIAAVIHRHLLLDDIRVEGCCEVIGLARQIGARVIIDALVVEGGVARVGPQDARQA